MDALQAAVLRVKAPRLDGWTEARRSNAARYRRLFRAAGCEGPLKLPAEPPDRRHICQSVRHPHARTRRAQAPSRRGRHRQRDLLSVAAAPAAPVSRALAIVGATFLHAERASERKPGHSNLRGSDNGAQQQAVVDAIAGFLHKSPSRRAVGQGVDGVAP